ncbi:hypothetical protein [Bacillus sp. B4EP4a]|nr:hypothetical protein [Bacillus sp. B4EP4a]
MKAVGVEKLLFKDFSKPPRNRANEVSGEVVEREKEKGKGGANGRLIEE